MSGRPDITPDLKVADLLTHYPELEEVLISLSPEFRRLKNPVLRRTVAKLATLRQVAKVGGVGVGDLIATLRRAAGLAEILVAEDPESSERPHWWREPVRTFDAREVIESGGHPLERVMKDLAGLRPGDVYELVTPFVPGPLLDVARNKGYQVYCAAPTAAGEVHSYFTRLSGDSHPQRASD